MMNLKNCISLNILLLFSLFCEAQDSTAHLQNQTKEQGIQTAIDIGPQYNITGYNAMLRVSNFHRSFRFGFGMNYNISDGYLNDPVMGTELHLAVLTSQTENSFTTLGIEHIWQRVDKELNTQLGHMTMSYARILNKNWYLEIFVGAGFARDKFSNHDKTVDTFRKSGMIGLTCGYTLKY